MVSIGGFNLSFGSTGVKTFISGLFWGVVALIVVGLISWIIYRWYSKKVNYTHPVTITLIYDNGTEETKYGLKGAKFINKEGAWDFKVKIPKARKAREIGYLPDFSKADKDGTIHFVTCGDGTFWQQADWKTMITDDKNVQMLKKPIISSDEKSIMIKDIKNWRDVVAKNKITAFAIGLGMFLIMVIAHLVSLYVQTKIKCGV